MRKFNMRKYCYVFLWLSLLVTVGIVWAFGAAQKSPEKPLQSSSQELPKVKASPLPKANEELTGVWVPYFSLSTQEHTQAAFEAKFKSIADSARSKGINALFVHVRPFCDALYPSKLFPWSHILTGTQGKDPGFDPLAFMVDYAHKNKMELHAWLNPLRVKSAETPAKLAGEGPYTMHEDSPYYFMEHEGAVYLNPAYPYVRTLIADGAAEIAKNYDVDGIHFDDYFYPGQEESLDSEAYAVYTENVETPISLQEWRTANISAMVAEVYKKIKAANKDVIFGISPQGNIENDENMGADVKTWCAVSGYVDYICPQLYYSFENEALGYSEALKQWQGLVKHEKLKMYAGLALYKAGSDADSGTWLLSEDIIAKQIAAAREVQCSGVILYSSDYLEAEQTREEVKNAMAELEGG